MEQLHAWGGTPPGWKFSPAPGDPAAGRKTFVEFGCYKCHKIAGEDFPPGGDSSYFVGPELTGMGSHHPPGYFAEAIVNPNAILVEGPGYLDENGHSRMPEYPDMTLEQLADLVAYLTSLKESNNDASASSHHGAGAQHHEHHHQARGKSAVDRDNLSYFAQAFEVEDERLEEFYRWFDEQRFNEIPGLERIETYASRERREGRHVVLVLFGFEHDGALESFRSLRSRFPLGSFPRPTDHCLLETPPVYRAVQMSR
ncbi:MAG: c-type cytochrome [Candidatus Binatia bacterium]|nr:c-type cytochrome [Candidatus Binatia bacterium]